MTTQKIAVPDIGDIDAADVIEVHIREGETIELDAPIITLESEKASMDVPSPVTGIVKQVEIKVGDKIAKGDIIAEVEVVENDTSNTQTGEQVDASVHNEAAKVLPGDTPSQHAKRVVPLVAPDFGDVDSASIIELMLDVNASITKDSAIMVVESEKASMEIPAEHSGTIKKVYVKQGDTVESGSHLADIEIDLNNLEPSAPTPSAEIETTSSSGSTPISEVQAKTSTRKAPVPDYPIPSSNKKNGKVHASPSVRRFARELGADLTKVNGSGPKNRVLKEDVQSFIKYELSRPKVTSTSTFGMPELPKVDFSKFGEVEEIPLTRIQKVSSVALHRNWVIIPHVTQHEEADITELEAFRKSMKKESEAQGVRLTVLAFVIKAVTKSLQAFPTFNASLAPDGENIFLKKYFHIGVAVDTPDGLVVPVIRDVDKKSVNEIAAKLAELSVAAREKKLSAEDMKGSCFTISSLGGVGGTSFTPIVNWPDVAILGLSRHAMKPVWDGEQFIPRLMLPISLSYDHRVIDGAVAASFAVHLKKNLEDIRRVML